MFSSTELVSRASAQDVRPVAGHRGRGEPWQGLELGDWGGRGMWARLFQSRSWSSSLTLCYLQSPPSAFSLFSLVYTRQLDPFRV